MASIALLFSGFGARVRLEENVRQKKVEVEATRNVLH